MFRLLTTLAGITVILGTTLLPTSAHAASTGPMPRTDYPFHSTIQVTNPLDTAGWDCGIAVDCNSGEPLVHSALGEDLGRVTGWAVVTSSHHFNLQFITTSNTFQGGLNDSGEAWNQAALDDETNTMPTWQVAHPITLTLPTLPDGARTLSFRIGASKKEAGMLFVSAAWGETSEVELFAIYSHTYAKQAKRLILKQLRDIVTTSPATEPTPTSTAP